MASDTQGLTRRAFLRLSGLGTAALAANASVRPLVHGVEKPMRPNIVILFVDDMGYSDIGCFGGEIETPNLDALAADGVRFTQFYNTARSCPARASLLTGLYPHQAGIGMMVYRDSGDGYEGNLNDRCVTFGEVLRSAGYRTMMVGKWHAGHEPQSRPEVRGFECFTGIYPHIDSYWKVLRACDVYRDRKLLIPAGEDPVNPYHPDDEFYTTDFFTDTALDYIDRASEDKAKPFLLHVCYNAPHFPLEAPDDLIEKYRGRYMTGWDALREEKLARMKEMGIVGPGQRLPRVKGFGRRKAPGFTFRPTIETRHLPKWDSLSHARGENDRRELDFRRAIYAAQIDRLDQNVGRIVRRLRARGVLDETLIMFFSDNGCSGELGPFGMNWRKYTSANYREWRKTGGWSISQGQCWASASNAPLRKYKIFTHEGGIASPFIAHWPKGIAEGGRIFGEQMFHLIDVMPTLCEVSGAAYPETFEGRTITPAQGMSMVPFMKGTSGRGGAGVEERTLYWQHETNAAVREGDWKLVTSDDRSDRAWELYNFAGAGAGGDRSESEDLAGDHPDVAQRLARKWRRWAEEVGALPHPEERARPKGVPWPPRPWPEE